MKKTMLISVFILTTLSIIAVTNTWDGSSNWNWNIGANWSRGTVPTASEDVIIPSSSNYTTAPYITFGSNGLCGTLEIQADGQLRIGDATVTVTNDLTIYGYLWFSDVNAVVDVNDDIIWKSGSSDNINQGEIRVADNWTFENGTNCTLGTGNTVVFDATGGSTLYYYEADATFGNLEINKPGTGNSTIIIGGSQQMDVAGDMTVFAGNIFNIQSEDLIVNGTLDIEDSAEMCFAGSNGTLELNSDFELDGELDVGSGDVLAHGEFELETTGELTIAGGSFISDDSGRAYQYLRGTFNISSGLFELTHNSINVASTCSDNISGGTIRVGGAFNSSYNGTFQPSGGIVEMAGSGGSGIQIHSSNYFEDLIINDNTWASTGLTVNDELQINSGYFNLNGHTVDANYVGIYGELRMTSTSDILNVGRNITFYTGSSENISSGGIFVGGNFSASATSVFTPTGGTVDMTAAHTDGSIYMNTGNTFYNLVINDFTELNTDMDITSFLYVSNDVFHLNGHKVDVGTSVFVYSTLRMTNANDELSTNGIYWYSGSEDTVTAGNIYVNYWSWFDGTDAQLGTGNTAHVAFSITSEDYSARFGNLEIGSSFREENERDASGPISVSGDFTALSGANWTFDNGFNVYGDATIESGAIISIDDITVYGDTIIESGSSVLINGGILYVLSNLYIDGELDIENSGAADCPNNTEISGHVIMNDSDSYFDSENITWLSGSTANITSGFFTITGNWYFNDGTNVQIGTGNTVRMGSFSTPGNIYCYDADASFGSFTADYNLIFNSASTQPMRVDGDLDVQIGGVFTIQSDGLMVDGTLDIKDGARMAIGSNGELELNSDFALNGELDVGAGDALIHGEFELASTGELTIDGGSFIYDEGLSTSLNILGTFNMSDGLFQADEWFGVSSSASTSITGGFIRASAFSAVYAGTFQPTAGTVEIQTDNGGFGYIRCSNGNYFRYLSINPTSGGGGILQTDITVQNDLEITTGQFYHNGYESTINNDMNIYGDLRMDNSADALNIGNNITWFSGSDDYNLTNGTINVSGDWYFNNGTDVELGTGNTVNFNGSTTQNIYCYDADAAFGSVGVDKSGGNLNINTTSTQPMQVDGYLDIIAANNFNIQTEELIVDGELNIYDGSKMTIASTGSLINNSIFYINGELDVGLGDIEINDRIMVTGSGELIIDGGNATCDFFEYYGALTLSSGIIQTNQFIAYPGGTANVSGGLIRTNFFSASGSGNFEPTGGKVEMYYSGSNLTAYVRCYNGNYLHNLDINFSGDAAEVNYGDLQVHNNLEITSGVLDLAGWEINVWNDAHIYGELKMYDSNDKLNVNNNIYWHSGSDTSVLDGTINILQDWYFYDGTNSHLGVGNTVNFVGTESQFIYCYDEDAYFGNVAIDQSGYPIYAVWLDTSSTYDIQVAGDFTVEPDNIFQVSSETLTVDGTIDIEENGLFYLEHTGGQLINNSDFTLNGEMDIDGGDVLIHGEFNQNTSGTLTIDGGSLIDDSAFDDEQRILNGTLNMSDGILEISYNTLALYSSFIDNITGGTIRSGRHFYVWGDNIFQPSGGTVERITQMGLIDCDNSDGNYIHDLVIEYDSTVMADLTINGSITINSGWLSMRNNRVVDVANNVNIYDTIILVETITELNVGNDVIWYPGSGFNSEGTINISEDWYFNDGTDVQLGTGNTVNFVGSENSTIYCDDADACFGNLVVDKDDYYWDYVFVNEGDDIRVAADVDINSGHLSLLHSEIGIGNSLNINNNGIFHLNGYPDHDAVITHYQSDFYDLNIESGGTITSNYAIYEYVGGDGVHVKAGADMYFDADWPFNYCIFQNGESGGSLLTIDNDDILTIYGAEFYAGSRDAIYNVTKNVNVGDITFTNSSGAFDGPDYENDPNNRLHWGGFTIPTVTTDEITEITQTTAKGGGEVTADGGCSVSARGVCWSVSANPTIADNITSDGTGTGAFLSSLTTLDPNTLYYVRSYATNILGTAYGNEATFTTLENIVPPNAPENVTISVAGGDVNITWDSVAGADSYKVYSTDDPNEPFGSWAIEQDNITELTWSETIPASNKFYQVTANTGVIRRRAKINRNGK